MRTLVGVLVVVLVLVPLAAAAVRGVRRVAWPAGGADEVGRTTLQTVTEGLIVLAAVIVAVVVVVAIAD